MTETIRIKDFKGVNKKFDPADMSNHECQTCDGFEVSTKPGALVKRKGYTDQADGTNLPESYPQSWTVKNFFRFVVNKPSAKTITVVHATVSDEDRVYVDWTYDGSAWVHDWVELTENEEDLTALDPSSPEYIFNQSLNVRETDYYKGWYLFNWTIGVGTIISSYDGIERLIMKDQLTGQTAGDSFSIYRFPLITQFEGTYSADTDSSITTVVDSAEFSDDSEAEVFELKQDFDDAYNDWTLYNTTRGLSDTITDYEAHYAGNERHITVSDVTDQAEADSFYLYKKTRELLVDDKISFRQRYNTCLMATGNQARYPKQYPLWYGFIRKNYYFGDADNAIDAGFYLEPATLDAPDNEILSVSAETATDNTGLTVGTTYYFACAYVYDGYQVGSLTSGGQAVAQKCTIATAGRGVPVSITIGYSYLNNMKHSKVLNKRVTHVDLYMSDDFDITTGAGAWYKIKRTPIRQDAAIGKQLGGIISVNSAYQFVITPRGRESELASKEDFKFNWTAGTNSYTRSFTVDGDMWANKGFSYSTSSGGMGGDRSNYEIGEEGLNHSIVGKLYQEEAEESLVAFSAFKADGSPSQDYYPLLNILNASQYGVSTITNLKLIEEKLYILGSEKSIKLIMSSGIVPAFKLASEFEFIGTDATFGCMKYKDGVFVVSKRGIFYLDNIEHLISYPIEDPDDFPLGVTTLSEAYMALNGEKNELVFSFPTDEKIYTYSLATRQWEIHSLADGLVALCTGEDGELYGATSSKIVRLHNGTTDDSTAIDPDWKSKIYNFGNPDLLKLIKEIDIVYKSDTIFQIDLYLNRSSTAATWNSSANQIVASTSATSKRIQVPTSFQAHEFEFGFSIPSANQATNTDLEIYEISLVVDTQERYDT